jgi:PAS domain S-box-containing protein
MADRYSAGLVASTNAALAALTTQGVIETWNSGAEQVFGLPAAEAIGQPLRDIIPPDERSDIQGAIDEAAATGWAVHYGTNERPDGKQVVFDAVIRRVVDEGGTWLSFSARDTTDHERMVLEIFDQNWKLEQTLNEQRRLELELREQSREELLRQNQVLTDTLLRVQHLQAQAISAERMAAIGELAASVAHDLRTPLTSIRNALAYFGKLLATADLGKRKERAESFLGIMHDELDASIRIVQDLVDYARARPPSLRPLAVRGLVDRMTAPPSLQLVNSVGENLPVLEADVDQLASALAKLVQNSADAAASRIQVEAEALEGQVALRVVDNGRGIAPENLPRVLTPLFTTKLKGSGLGLPIAEGIVLRHGGRLEIASTPGTGTTVTIYLPSPRPMP